MLCVICMNVFAACLHYVCMKFLLFLSHCSVVADTHYSRLSPGLGSTEPTSRLWSIFPSLEIKPAVLISTPHLCHIIHVDSDQRDPLSPLSQSFGSTMAKKVLSEHFIIFCPHINRNPDGKRPAERRRSQSKEGQGRRSTFSAEVRVFSSRNMTRRNFF